MSQPVDELVLKISADINGLQTAMARVVGASEEMAKKTHGHAESMTESFIKAEVAVELLKTAFEKIKEVTVDYIGESLKNIDQQAKLADRLGITTQAVAMLKIAGEDAGLSLSDMTGAMQKMERSLAEAAKTASPAADALRQLGLDLDSLQKARPDEAMMMVADAFSHLQGSATKAQVATELFGRSGTQLVGVLSQGRAGFEEAAKSAAALGLAVDRFDAAKVEQANKAWRELHDAAEGIANQFAIALAPAIVGIGKALTDSATNAANWRDTAGNAVAFVAKMIDGFRAEVMYLQIAWDGIKVGVTGFGLAALEAFNVAAKGVVYAVDALDGFGRALSRTGELITQTFITGFQIAATGVERFVADVTDSFARMLDNVGKAMVAGGVKGAADVVAAAATVQIASGTMSASAQKNAQDARIAWTNAADDAAFAWTNVLPDFADIKIGGLDELIETYKGKFDDFHADLNQSLNQPFDDTAVRDWLAKVTADVNATAKHTADIRKKDLDQEGSANVQKQNWDKQTWDQKLGYASSTMDSLGQLMEHGSRKQFEIGKKLQLAAAIADTAAGVAKTFQQFGWYALLGPAEAVAAAGAVQIARISSMSYGGGGGGASGGTSVSASAAPSATPGVSGQQQGGQNVTIALQGSVFNAQSVRDLVGQINQFVRDGGQLAGLQVQT